MDTKRILASGVLLFLSWLAAAEPVKDKDYWAIPTVQGIEPATSDNLYFTWFGCSSCSTIEQQLAAELEGFEIVPLIARPEWRPAAKIFYVLQMLEIDPQVRQQLLIDIEQAKLDPTNLEAMRLWLLEQPTVQEKVDEELLNKTLEDRQLFKRVAEAVALAKNYNIQYAPTVVVKGQYATDARHTMTIKKFKDVLAYLKQL
ncbi:MAG: hypothetical protein HWD86_05680 [Kangiellaceae bacterium]|nr:hypothetical protein [Kangiellaceae bacterium]